jgi:DNA-binding response OmpR family regulator
MSHQSRLLVVDDDPNNCKLLKAVLAPHGYAVSTAKSGREALDVIAAEPPDLVLLDIVMPELSGYEVCRTLRDGAATRALPVIMLTSSGDQDKVRAIEAGADDFIGRPFDQMELLARVRSLLRIKDTTTRSKLRLPSWPSGTSCWRRESVPKWVSWNGSAGSGASCRRKWRR